jgi:ABC-type multidrug transport system ATPase subunit
VTIGIEMTESPRVWLFDKPTTGLDSKASFDVSALPLSCTCVRAMEI